MNPFKKALLILGTSLVGCLAKPSAPASDTFRRENQPKYELETIVESDSVGNSGLTALYTCNGLNHKEGVALGVYNTEEGSKKNQSTLATADFGLLFSSIDTLAVSTRPSVQFENQSIKNITSYTTPEGVTVQQTDTEEIDDGKNISADFTFEFGNTSITTKERKYSFSLRPFFYDKEEEIKVETILTYPDNSTYTASFEDTKPHKGAGGQLVYSGYLTDTHKLKARFAAIRHESDKQEEYLAGISLIGTTNLEEFSYSLSAFWNQLEEKKDLSIIGGSLTHNLESFGYGFSAVCDSSKLWNLATILSFKSPSDSFDRYINDSLINIFEQEYLERGLPQKQLELEKDKTTRNLERKLENGAYLILGTKQDYSKDWSSYGRIAGIIGSNKPLILGLTYGPFLERKLPNTKAQLTADITYTFNHHTLGAYFTHEKAAETTNTLGGLYRLTF